MEYDFGERRPKSNAKRRAKWKIKVKDLYTRNFNKNNTNRKIILK